MSKRGTHSSPKTEFQKGKIPWNKGTKGIMKSWNKGTKIDREKFPNMGHFKKHTEKSKEKSRLSHIGKSPWNKGIKTGLIPRTAFKKGHIPKVHFLKGQKPWNYQGGISFEPYGLEFNEDLKEVIRNRDRRKCQICEKTELDNKERLTVHHIDYSKKNNDPKNLISLCRICHAKTNHYRNYWLNYFKGILTALTCP